MHIILSSKDVTDLQTDRQIVNANSRVTLRLKTYGKYSICPGPRPFQKSEASGQEHERKDLFLLWTNISP